MPNSPINSTYVPNWLLRQHHIGWDTVQQNAHCAISSSSPISLLSLYTFSPPKLEMHHSHCIQLAAAGCDCKDRQICTPTYPTMVPAPTALLSHPYPHTTHNFCAHRTALHNRCTLNCVRSPFPLPFPTRLPFFFHSLPTPSAASFLLPYHRLRWKLSSLSFSPRPPSTAHCFKQASSGTASLLRLSIHSFWHLESIITFRSIALPVIPWKNYPIFCTPTFFADTW